MSHMSLLLFSMLLFSSNVARLNVEAIQVDTFLQQKEVVWVVE